MLVYDSRPQRLNRNLAVLQRLERYAAARGLDPKKLPAVAMYNKRDEPSALPVAVMRLPLNPHGWPEVEAVARAGMNLFDPPRWPRRTDQHPPSLTASLPWFEQTLAAELKLTRCKALEVGKRRRCLGHGAQRERKRDGDGGAHGLTLSTPGASDLGPKIARLTAGVPSTRKLGAVSTPRREERRGAS